MIGFFVIAVLIVITLLVALLTVTARLLQDIDEALADAVSGLSRLDQRLVSHGRVLHSDLSDIMEKGIPGRTVRRAVEKAGR